MSIDKQQILYRLAEVHNIPINHPNIVNELMTLLISGSTYSTDWCNYWILIDRLYIHLIQDFNQTCNGTLFMYDRSNTDTSSTAVTFSGIMPNSN